MQTFIALVEAFAKLAWPILFFVALLWFRRDISSLLNKTKKAKLFGNEFEFDAEAAKLATNVDEVLHSNPSTIPQNSIKNGQAETSVDGKSNDSADETSYEMIYDNAGTLSYLEEKINSEPHVAIILIASQIEKSLRLYLAQIGIRPKTRGTLYLSKLAINHLGYPINFSEALQRFFKFRNAILHSHEAENLGDFPEVARTGLNLLRFMAVHSPERLIVDTVELPVFLDLECKDRALVYEGMGLIIAARPGATGSHMYVITDQKNKYEKEMEVSSVFKKVDGPDVLYIKPEQHDNLVYKISLDKKGVFRGEDIKKLLTI